MRSNTRRFYGAICVISPDDRKPKGVAVMKIMKATFASLTVASLSACSAAEAPEQVQTEQLSAEQGSEITEVAQEEPA